MPQATHNTLLRMKTQKPALRFGRESEATNQAAATDAANAGHWISESRSK